MRQQQPRSSQWQQHHQEIKQIGAAKDCPLTKNNELPNFISWLKLQNQKLEYRLLFWDLAIFLSFILLLFTSLRFQASVLPNRWFFALVMFLLIACCCLFIGIHLLQHREADLKVQAKYVVIDWSKYRKRLQRWPLTFGLYSFLLFALACLHFCNDETPPPMVSTGLLVMTATLFATGIIMLVRTIRTKENTQIYVAQATKR